MQGVQIRSLVGELRFHMLHVMAKEKKDSPSRNVSVKVTLQKTLVYSIALHTLSKSLKPSLRKKILPSSFWHVDLLKSTPFFNTYLPNFNSLLL